MLKKILTVLLITIMVAPCAVFASGTAQADADALSLGVIAPYDGGSKEITRSLYLPDKGSVYNSEITWVSDNEKYITNSGRVIRPKFDEENVTVVLTATIKGDETVTKTFEFTVLSDEKFVDSQHMSDEEFFGKWNGVGWVRKGKLDYSYPGLQSVESYVKNEDYKSAKDALLTYFKGRTPPANVSTRLGKTRTPKWVEMISDDFYQTGNYEYYRGEIEIGNELKDYTAELPLNTMSVGMISFGVRAWYNEASFAKIYSKDNGDITLAPRLKITTANGVKTYTAVKDITIRHGDYSNTNYGKEKELTVKTFGDFLEEETWQSVITFDLSDIENVSEITKAEMILHGYTYPAFSGAKRIILLKEANTVWDELTANRYTFPGMVYSFNGLPQKNNWQKVAGQEGEYFWQSSRFAAWPYAALEYHNTKDEELAYKYLSIMADYIKDTGGRKFVGNSYTENINGLRGGFPRTLDTAIKNNNWEKTLDTFKESEYFTSDILTAILKNIWDSAHYLVTYHAESENWRQHEFMSILTTTKYLPEFYDVYNGEKWYKYAENVLEDVLFLNTMEDGSYVESSTGYSVAALSDFSSFKSSVEAAGGSVSEEYKERLLKNAYYNVVQYFPDGSGLRYGDASNIELNPGTYNSVYLWSKDENLKYISTLGKEGIEPEFTSVNFPDSRLTVMRDNWTTNSPYLITNVRGGGGHGHADDNQIVLYAYGRPLLIDSGIFSYASTSEMMQYTEWGKSSLAHNTVVINGKSQVYDGKKGVINEIALEDEYNYLRQTTGQTEGFDHERAILYLKPDLWIVSDKITSDEIGTSNNFKQLWHTPLNTEISKDGTSFKTNYSSGANLIITSADSSKELLIEDGWYDKSTNEVAEIKYGAFTKNTTGTCRFDTLLTVTNDDTEAKVTSETLLKTDGAVAVRYDISKNTGNQAVYYYRSEEGSHIFANFETNAQVLAILCDSNGNIEKIVRIGGSYVKNTSTGEYINADEKPAGNDITAGVNNNSYAVFGSVDKSYAGSNVTAMLVKNSASEIKSSDIAWFGITEIDENGEYILKFKTDVDISEYTFKMNIMGMPLTKDFVSVSDNGTLIYANLNTKKKENAVDLILKLNNLYSKTNQKYKIIVAFYDNTDKLVNIWSSDEKNLSYGISTESMTRDYPENTSKIKVLIWDGLTPVSTPLPEIKVE
ncbi:MAG: alginate lyase family protein [Clostridia bacterium]|nr:alginate lyase family protein [Clostridia bacterium]